MVTQTELPGRQQEIAQLADLLDRGQAAGAALLLLGDPGIGKSALLQAARQLAGRAGWQVLSTTGVPSEAQLPYAGLHQLLRPVLSQSSALPPVQREALLAAFGLSEGAPPEPLLIALATRQLLEVVAASNPVLVLADDVHWHDPQTHDTLTFLARRVGPRVGLIAAMRSGHEGPILTVGIPELTVTGVDDATAAQILQRYAAHLTPAEQRRIQHQASGNPLALLELPVAWQEHPPPDIGTDAIPVSLPTRLEQAFAARIGELPTHTRDAVLVAAVGSQDALAELLAATSVLVGEQVDAAVFEPAVRIRLVTVDAERVGFRHPLVRSGALQSETLSRRQAANAALSEVLVDEPYRRTWHRAQSVVGPDDRIAEELETNVAVALRRGGVVSAIANLERAAQLTSCSAQRGHRLLLAAEHAFGLGRADIVNRLVHAASSTNLSELDWARLEWLSEIFNDGVPGDAARVFELCRSAIECTAAGDVDLALNLLLGAALRCWWADTGPAARTRVVEAARQLPDTGSDPRYLAAIAVAEPVRECAWAVDRLAQLASAGSLRVRDGIAEDVADADGLRLLGMAAHAVGDEARAADLLDEAETVLREQGRFGLLPHVLSMQVQIRTELGDWTRALAAADEGRRLAEETGQPIWNTGTQVCEARTNALRGQTDQALRLAARAESAASRHGLNDLLAVVQLARGCAWLSESQYDTAYAELRRMFDPADPSYHQRERFAGVMYLAEAAALGAHRDDALPVIADLERVSTAVPAPILRVHLLYAQAVLADDRDAEELYLRALSQDLRRWPWAGARLQLGYGTWLRRHHRPVFRGRLRSALVVFDAIGARTWAERARAQLTEAT